LPGKERDAALQAKDDVARERCASCSPTPNGFGGSWAGRGRCTTRRRSGSEAATKRCASREEGRTLGEREGKAELALQGTRLEITHLEQLVRERHLMELGDVAAARREPALQLDLQAVEETDALAAREDRALARSRSPPSTRPARSASGTRSSPDRKPTWKESIAKLRSAIARIDRASKERFKETFELVNDRFQQVFPALFPRAWRSCNWSTTRTNPGRGARVEIVAQPPGKKARIVGTCSPRREGADGGLPDLRHLPHQAHSLLPPRRGATPRSTRQTWPVQRDGARDVPPLRSSS